MRYFIPAWLLAFVCFLPVCAETSSVDFSDLRKGLNEVGEKLLQLSSKLPPDDKKGGNFVSVESEKTALQPLMNDAEKSLTIASGSVKEVTPEPVEKKKTIKKPILTSKKKITKKKETLQTVTEEPNHVAAEPLEIKDTVTTVTVLPEVSEHSEAKVEDSEQKAVEQEEKTEDIVVGEDAELLKKTDDVLSLLKNGDKTPAAKKVTGQVEIGLKAEDIDDARIKDKMKRAEKMAKDATVFFKGRSLGEACRSFQQDSQWRAGDLYITVFSDFGACLVDGWHTQRLWDDFILPTRDELTGLVVSDSFVLNMLELGEGGGWVSYDWDFGIRFAYAKTVLKRGLKYVIAVGFYPDSPRFAIQQLVKKAIRYGERTSAHQLFEQINNPRGVFVRGDLYLWAYDFDGFAYAHGRNIVFVGQNRKDWKDSIGFKRNQRMIEITQVEGRGWIDYAEDGLPKTAYFESLLDPRTGRRYIVGGGYYPTINDDMVVNFVKRAINYLKANGADIAFRDFSSYAGKFVEGPLRVFAYNLDGTMVADSENPIFIGQNLVHTRDSEGTEIVVRILNAVKNEQGAGWITFKDKGANRSAYVEYVEVPDGKFIIGAGYWPTSKEYTARVLVEKAEGYLKATELSEAIRNMMTPSNQWMRGDLYVRVYSENGICLGSGLDRQRIWHDENKHLDEKGYSVFKRILSTARGGGGSTDYPMYGYPYRAHVRLVEKSIAGEVAEERLAEVREKRAKENKRNKLKIVAEDDVDVTSLTEQYIVAVGYFL